MEDETLQTALERLEKALDGLAKAHEKQDEAQKAQQEVIEKLQQKHQESIAQIKKDYDSVLVLTEALLKEVKEEESLDQDGENSLLQAQKGSAEGAEAEMVIETGGAR